MEYLTATQREAYRKVLDFYQNYKRVPSVNEFKGIMELETRQGAYYLYNKLVEFGVIRKNGWGRYEPTERLTTDMNKSDVIALLKEIITWVEQL